MAVGDYPNLIVGGCTCRRADCRYCGIPYVETPNGRIAVQPILPTFVPEVWCVKSGSSIWLFSTELQARRYAMDTLLGGTVFKANYGERIEVVPADPTAALGRANMADADDYIDEGEG